LQPPDSFRLLASKHFEQWESGMPLLTCSYHLALRGAPQLPVKAQFYAAPHNCLIGERRRWLDSVGHIRATGWLQAEILSQRSRRSCPSSTLEKIPLLGAGPRGLCGKIDSATIRQMNVVAAL
jgi:hypothetical protein